MQEVKIYTDGACRGNPDGPGGYAAVLLYRDNKTEREHRKEISGGLKNTTNNRMELMGAIAGLEALNKPCRVKLYSDSQYLVNAFNKGWLVKWQNNDWFRDKRKKEKVKNLDLWLRFLEAVKPHQVEFIWVRGHDGNPENERCDELAVSAALSEDLVEDTERIKESD